MQWRRKIKKIAATSGRSRWKTRATRTIESEGIETISRYFHIPQAVKRSRVKSKLRTLHTLERVNQLKVENELLEEKIKMLTKELGFLKDLFVAHSGSNQHSMNIQDIDLNALLEDKPDEEPTKTITKS
ncbi:CCAAT/enhancer-binding protein gamma isoform X1 [Harpegnathos saltator]|uniref:CCAAT/enhancer-binding protein gamma isoform X1 n=1 Tax=Harpegnathos saltator TaxID=610380 RepID=UPI000DBEF29B|nr:CCAAT/enhancer-binding protein gamma isoform X1 [Harpegnathos saltator]